MMEDATAVNAAIRELINALSEQRKAQYVQCKQSRAYYKGRLTYFTNQLDLTPQIAQGTLTSMMSSLKGYYSKFDEIQTNMEREFPEIEAAIIPSERELFDNAFFNLHSRINQLLIDFNEPVGPRSVVHANPITPRVQLPPANVPDFDGDRKNWLSWRSIFHQMIGNRQDIDDAVKLTYLQAACVKGNASHLVNASSNTTFASAMEKLSIKYDNDVQLKYQLIAELYNIKAPEVNSSKSLEEYVLRIESCVGFLNSSVSRALNEGDDEEEQQVLDNFTCNMFVIHHLATKLDPESRKEFEKLKQAPQLITYEKFMTFLRARVQYLEASREFKPQATSTPKAPTNAGDKKDKPQRSRTYVATPSSHDDGKRLCPFCQHEHSVFECTDFKNLSIDDRQIKAKDLRLCYNCLKGRHLASKCTGGNCLKCGKKHHTLLHRSKTDNTNSTNNQDEKSNGANNSTQPLRNMTASAVPMNSVDVVVLATAVIWIEDCQGTRVPCRAFLDSGSTVCFITNRMVQLLNLKKEEVNMLIGGINNQDSCNKYKVSTAIGSRIDSQFSISLDFLVTRRITGDLPVSKVLTADWSLPSVEELADPHFGEPSQIDVLLGAEVFFEVLLDQKQQLANSLWMYSSKLGYIIAGKVKNPEPKNFTVMAISDLKDLMQRFWEMEAADNKSCQTLEEKAAEKHYVKHVQQRADKHYEVALPTNNLINRLGDSSQSAMRIFLASERRLDKQPEKKNEYNKFMQEMLDLSHMEIAPQNVTGPIYFMTHHMITRLSSTTTRYRVVFNASHPTNSGISLNDALMVGPTIQSEIFTHLIRWRAHLVALVSDAEKMYRQVYVREDDRDLQRIWWRFDSKQPLKPYRLTTVTYGTASAPFLAIRTLKQLADDQVLSYPDVADFLANNFYVDDYVSSHCDVEVATHVKSRLNQLANEGGFTLRKWASNKYELNDECIKDDVTSVLGVTWNKKDDTIVLSFANVKMNPAVTKSTVLGEIASLYDPLGLCSPIVMKAKLIMQRIWTETECNWDDKLTGELLDVWNDFRQQLSDMQQLTVSRTLINNPDEKLSLHGFCDASSLGYGACIYIVSGASSQLICAKSRVAPTKPTTIPRLELCSAVLLAKLMVKVVAALDLKHSRKYYWSDSEINVYRIKSPAGKFNVYVGTRIGDIQELTNPVDWKHVASADNPADLVSRSVMPNELKRSTLWWHGPEFLLKSMDKWPTQVKFDALNEQVNLELKKQVVLQAVTELVSSVETLFGKFYSWKRMKMATAYILRFLLNSKKALKYRRSDPVDKQEAEEAEIRILRSLQMAYFENEFKDLSKKDGILQLSSKLIQLNPFIDEDGLLRVGGRLHHANIPFDQKHQIILPNCDVTMNILRHLHEQNFHCGPQQLLSTCRQRYWILKARSTCRKVVHNCVICVKNRPVLLKQLMGDIPKTRFAVTRPFLNTGIDFAGPFYIRPQPKSKIVIKVYVAIFTCFSTRCVHLEVVSDLSSDSFLSAFRRFVSRRGVPSSISTDNATNFVGAQNDLKELREAFFNTETVEKCKELFASVQINWLHIPPRCPHWGGLWESIVKQMKYHLRRVTKEKVFDPDNFHTLIVQIEGILNSRPLTPISNDVNDLQPLTPGHFLIGAPLNSIPEPTWCDVPDNRLEQWQQMLKMLAWIWRRFQIDYFNELQFRAKWRTAEPNVKIGTLVIIHEDNLPPRYWKMGRVVAVFKGPDDKVRSVELRTVNGLCTRAIAKIAPLPIETTSDEK